MRVGFVGLGKLGLPVATAMALRGADVMGYDVDPARMTYGPHPWREAGPDGVGDFNEVLTIFTIPHSDRHKFFHASITGTLRFGSLEEVVAHAEILFVAVQTPHDARFGGDRPVVDDPIDFDYSHLCRAVRDITLAKEGELGQRELPLVVISTVLPGTMRREVMPFIAGYGLRLVYNPHFIAMGTTMRDFLNPEFVLVGADPESHNSVGKVMSFYDEFIEDVDVRLMSIESAELTKVAYNTYISTKIAVANTLMEICHKVPGADVDQVSDALQAATKRVASGMYMRGGMGDGGGCHPRDNIALGWLAQELNLSYDPFTAAMRARERQSAWLRELVEEARREANTDCVVLAGVAFKPGTNITAGSPALLLAEQLRAYRQVKELVLFDPHVYPEQCQFPLRMTKRCVVVLSCLHPEFVGWDAGSLPNGSVVIDPHRVAVCSNPSVRLVSVGVGKKIEQLAPAYRSQTVYPGTRGQSIGAVG